MARGPDTCPRWLSETGWAVTPELVTAYEKVLDTPLAEAVDRLTEREPHTSTGCRLAAVDTTDLTRQLHQLRQAVHTLATQVRVMLATANHSRENERKDEDL